jgi:tRNA(adenine34) deaminase
LFTTEMTMYGHLGEGARPEDEKFMRIALEQAQLGESTPGGGEVGCVIVRDGEVLVAAHNEAELRHDPTAHAEIVALRKLGEKLQAIEFRGCTIYCTLQPCSMCTAACIWAKVQRIVYGATRNDVHSMYFDARHFNTADLVADAFREDVEIVAGVLAEECSHFYYKPDESPPAEEQINT